MRLLLAVLVVIGVAGCNGSPESLGITGPGIPTAQPVHDDSVIDRPGIPDSGRGYGPSVGPMPSTGRYFNYN